MCITCVDFKEAAGRLLIIYSYSAFIKCFKTMECHEAMHQLFIDYKKAYDSVSRDVLYNILIEFCIPMTLVRLVKLCLTETYRSPVRQTPVGHISY